MIYTLENHELKHAVEEMLFHLLPTETLSKADSAEQLTEPYCRSILTEENGEAAARAIVCMDGVTHEAESVRPSPDWQRWTTSAPSPNW